MTKHSKLLNFLLFIFINIYYCYSQCDEYRINLVPNPNFESKDEGCCSTEAGYDDIPCVHHWHNIKNHFGSPDYYYKCKKKINEKRYWVPDNFMGSQESRKIKLKNRETKGKAYVGIIARCLDFDRTFYTEYIHVQLNKTLIAGLEYRASMFVSLADESDLACKGLSMLFTATPPEGDGSWNILSDYNPQVISYELITDCQNWIEVSDVFFAKGDERYLTIGIFDENLSVEQQIDTKGIAFAYYYIDDVSIIPVSICESQCPPDYIGEISYSEIPNACIPNKIPWSFKVSNAFSYHLYIFDRWGGLIWDFYEFNPNLFKDAYISWNGNKYNKEPVITDEVYNYKLEICNCNQSLTKHGDITVFSPAYLPLVVLQPEERIPYINGLNCEKKKCPEYIYIQNRVYDNYFIEAAQNFIVVSRNLNTGVNGPVIIDVNSNVQFIAGNYISLKDGFHAKSGSKFLASIKKCSNYESKNLLVNNKDYYNDNIANEISKQTIYDDASFLIDQTFLNLNNTSSPLSVNEDINCNINIYNLLGQKIYQTNKYKINQVSQQNILSYFDLTKGIYFISIQHNNTIQVKKIYIY